MSTITRTGGQLTLPIDPFDTVELTLEWHKPATPTPQEPAVTECHCPARRNPEAPCLCDETDVELEALIAAELAIVGTLAAYHTRNAR